MPITPERQNIEELRAAGFTEAQSLLLASKLEATAKTTGDDFKTFFIAELDRRFGEMDKRFTELKAEMDVRFVQLEARFERSLRLQLATILSAFVAVTTLAVAIIKLF